MTRTTQYILFWYIAETVPPAVEDELNRKEREQDNTYQEAPPFGRNLTLQKRIEMDSKDYDPVRHENTGVNEDEKQYVSSLVSVEEAIEKLGHKTVGADVVRRGWNAIRKRLEMEEVERSEDA